MCCKILENIKCHLQLFGADCEYTYWSNAAHGMCLVRACHSAAQCILYRLLDDRTLVALAGGTGVRLHRSHRSVLLFGVLGAFRPSPFLRHSAVCMRMCRHAHLASRPAAPSHCRRFRRYVVP